MKMGIFTCGVKVKLVASIPDSCCSQIQQSSILDINTTEAKFFGRPGIEEDV